MARRSCGDDVTVLCRESLCVYIQVANKQFKIIHLVGKQSWSDSFVRSSESQLHHRRRHHRRKFPKVEKTKRSQILNFLC